MELSLGEWLGEHKAAEYEATLRAEGCESVEVRVRDIISTAFERQAFACPSEIRRDAAAQQDLVDSELTEQHLGELGLKMFAKIRVWGAIQSLRRAKRPQLEQPPTPPDAASATLELTSRLHSKVPRFNRADPSARSLTWSQASQADSQLESDNAPAGWRQTRPRSPNVDEVETDADGRPAKVPRHDVDERPAQDACIPDEETPDSRDSDGAGAFPAVLDSVDQKLVRLKELYEKQLITREVYEAKQKELLNQLMPPPLSNAERSKRSRVEQVGAVSPHYDGDASSMETATSQDDGSRRSPQSVAPSASSVAPPAHANAAAAAAAVGSSAAVAFAPRRSGDRWGRSRRKVMGSQDSSSLPFASDRSPDEDQHTQTDRPPPRAASSYVPSSTQNSVSDSESSGNTPSAARRDRWSRSRRRAEASRTIMPANVADVFAESSESADEACAGPVLANRTQAVETTESESFKASASSVDTSASSAASLKSTADAQPQACDADDNWWESSSGSDTEDLRKDADDSSSLRALHASSVARSPNHQRHRGRSPSAATSAVRLGEGAHAPATTTSLQDALVTIKSEIAPTQPSASALKSSSFRTEAGDGINKGNVGRAVGAVASGGGRQENRSQNGTGVHVAAAFSRAPAAEESARIEVQAAAASAPGGRIFTGMSFAFLLDRDGLQLGKGRQLIFSNRVRELGGLVYDKLRPDSTTHIVTGKRHDHRKIMGFLSGMGVDTDQAKLVSVVCCDWITQCLKVKKLVDETDYLSDLSCRLRPYAWKVRQQQSDGPGALSVINTLTAGARGAAVLACAPAAVQRDPGSEEGLTDRVSVKLREDQLTSGDRQKLSDVRPSSRYSKVAFLDVHSSSTNREYDRGAGGIKNLSAPPAHMTDIDAMKFVRVPVTWEASYPEGAQASAAKHAELVGPIEKLQGLWQLAKRWQVLYWQQPLAGRKIETDFPYPLACFTRGRTDGHLNFEHDSMLGSDATYGQGTKPAVLIVIDPQEYEAYHGHWPHHLFFLLPESNRGVGYARHVFKEFALSGRAVQDQTKLAFPFYYEIDDLMYHFRELVRDDNGVKQFGTKSRPNLLRSMLSLQRLPDLQKYGLLGVGRDRGPIAGKANEFAVNTMSIYKFRLINVDLTRDVHYVPQLKKFEDIAFNYQLLKDGGGAGSYIPTFKSFKFVARASLRSGGGAAAGRQRLTRRCQPEDLLESGTQLDQLRVEHQQIVQELVQWVRDKQDEDVRRAKRRQDAILAAAANGGATPAAAVTSTADLSDDEDEEENDDRRLDFSRDGFASLTSKLFAHQKSAVRWLVKVEKTPGLHGGILADEMGLGKTITLLALIAGNTPANRDGSRLPTLVVLPLSLLNQWDREIRIHTHGLKTLVYYAEGRAASATQLAEHEIVLTTYDVLVNDDESSNVDDGSHSQASQDISRGALRGVKWHRLVCDEAAFIKNLDTQRARAVYRLKKSHVWLATGSPVQNNIKELQTLLRLCNFSGSFVDRDWRSLCRHVMLRRTMASVAGEVGSAGSGLKMPKLEETTVTLRWITDKEGDTYEKLASKAKAVKGAVHHELLSNVMRMRQACNHPSLATVVDREDTVEVDEHVGGGPAAGAAANSFALDAEGSLVESDDETIGTSDSKYECAKLTALMKVLDEAKVRVGPADIISTVAFLALFASF